MIDKHEYYHGAAIVRLLQDQRCTAIRKIGLLGYLVNEQVFLFIKYTTKSRSPWRFTFDREDVERANAMSLEHPLVLIPFVCGGDGICVITWDEGVRMLNSSAGYIAVARKHNEQYSVWGTLERLRHKVSLRRFPDIVFESSKTSMAHTGLRSPNAPVV